ncbi:MAG TPA: HD domain-containing protein [Gemmataceae bacterium]|jgi:3'-5' exoribonuclease
MSRRFVTELADGEAVEDVFLVSDKQLRANRNGNLYIQVDLRDRTGVINGRLWNAGEPLFRSFDVGDFVRARGKVQLFQGALQVILSHLDKIEANSVELTDFLPHTTQDIGALLQRLKDALRKVGNPHLRALAECFLMDDGFVRDFCQVPAGVRNHHAYVGGLLEHVVTLLDAAERLLPLYPGVDRDLLLVGVFLHDAGKVRELTCKKAFAYTDEGQLVGHIAIGVELVTEKAAEAAKLTGEPFPQELLLRVKHMILSHHGQLDFGSPVVPMTPEAIFLASLDNLDSKVHAFTRDIREDRNATSAWTPYSQALQRRLFKGMPASELPDAVD